MRLRDLFLAGFVLAFFGCALFSSTAPSAVSTVTQKEIKPGMSPQEVAATLGSPSNIVVGKGKLESWVYNDVAQDVSFAPPHEKETQGGGVMVIRSVAMGIEQNQSSIGSGNSMTVEVRFSREGKVVWSAYRPRS